MQRIEIDTSRDLHLLNTLTRNIFRTISSNGLPRERRLVKLIDDQIRDIGRAQYPDDRYRRSIFDELGNGMKKILLQPDFNTILQCTPMFDIAGTDVTLIRGTKLDIIHLLVTDDPTNRSAAKNETIELLAPRLKQAATELEREPGQIIIIDPNISKYDIIPYPSLNTINATEIPTESSSNQLSMIVLDVEGQYSKNYDKLRQMLKDEDINEKSLPLTDYFNIPDNSTLSSQELDPMTHMENFMPDLTQKSMENFKQALTNIKNRNNGIIRIGEDLKNDLYFEIQNNQTIHKSTSNSITNSLRIFFTKSKEIFDLDDLTPLTASHLLSPGLHVIDVSDLDEQNQRYVALYIMSILDTHKMKLKKPIRVTTLYDEAHKLFPRNPPSAQRDYFRRINDFVKDITKRGRKRHFGVIISTQTPKDVAEDMLNLADTTIAYRENSKWTEKKVGKRVQQLDVGQCMISAAGTKAPDTFLINTFNVSDSNPSRSHNGTQLEKGGNTIGFITTREKHPSTWKENKHGPLIPAYCPSEHTNSIIPGALLVSEHENNREQLITYWEVMAITKSYEHKTYRTDYGATSFKDSKIEDYRTHFTIRPIKQGTHGPDGRVIAGPFTPGNYTDTQLRTPTVQEYYDAYGLPSKGLLLGFSERGSIPYYLPRNPNTNETEGDWQIDHSMVVLGNQGTGKTNFLFYFTYQLASSDPDRVASCLRTMFQTK